MTVIPEDHVETVDELVRMMAKAIAPYAFSEGSSKTETSFAIAAAERALLVCVPVILTEASIALDHEDKRHQEAINIILDLKNLF